MSPWDELQHVNGRNLPVCRWDARNINGGSKTGFGAQLSVAGELDPDTTPEDADWGERYFHLTDPDGHEISFAKPLST